MILNYKRNQFNQYKLSADKAGQSRNTEVSKNQNITNQYAEILLGNPCLPYLPTDGFKETGDYRENI